MTTDESRDVADWLIRKAEADPKVKAQLRIEARRAERLREIEMFGPDDGTDEDEELFQ